MRPEFLSPAVSIPSVLPEIKKVEKVFAIKLEGDNPGLRQQKIWKILYQERENIPSGEGYRIVTVEQIADMIQHGAIKALDLQSLGEFMPSFKESLLFFLPQDIRKKLKLIVDDFIYQDCSSILNQGNKGISEFEFDIYTGISFSMALIRLQYKYLGKNHDKSDLKEASSYFKTVAFILELGVALQSQSRSKTKDIKDILKSRSIEVTPARIDSACRFHFNSPKHDRLIQNIQNTLRLSPGND